MDKIRKPSTNGTTSSRRRHRRDSPEEEGEPERPRKGNRDDVDGGDEVLGTARIVPRNHGRNHVQQHVTRILKPADEIIGVAVPRKARSASKRSHENWSCSPSSSNVLDRKKMKPNGFKQNPLKISSNTSSSNPEDLEIEIAEVLFGLRSQKEPDLTVPISDVASKRKRPGQVFDNFGISSTSAKAVAEGPSKIENLLPNSDKNPITKSDNVTFQSAMLDFASLKTPATIGDAAVVKMNSTSSETDTQREDKFEIDLMAPPPQRRSSPERDFVSVAADAEMKTTMLTQEKDEKASKSCRDEKLVEEPELKKARSLLKSDKFVTVQERNIDLQIDLRKDDKDDNSESLSRNNKLHPHVQKQHQHQLNVAKDEHPLTEKTAHASSLQLPMSLSSWPAGLPPIGYMAPLQEVVSMDGSQGPPTPIQQLFSQPRPKKCATHCYIARNIHSLQQFTKMNPFWPAGAVLGKEKADAQRKQQQIFLQQALPPGASPTNMLHGPAFIFPFNQQQAAPGPVTTNATTSASGNVSASAALTAPSMSFNYPNMPLNETQYLTLLQNNNAYPFPIPAAPFFNGSFYHPSQMIHSSQLPHPPGQQNATSASKTKPPHPHQPRNTESEFVKSTQAFSGTSNGNNFRGENKKQQNANLGGVEGGFPQTFAMSFASMKSANTAHNNAVLQNFAEAERQNYQLMQAHRKNFKVPEDGNKNGVGGDSSNVDEEKKGLAPKPSVTGGKSIAFTRPDQQQHIQQKHIQQQMVQIQKQHLQQPFVAARNNKTPPTSNGSVYADHLATSSPLSTSKFPQTMFQSGINNNLSQWKSSLKNAPQQSHTHISFGSVQKAQTVPHQYSTPPTTSLSKGGSAGSQCNKISSVSSQPPKSPSILGNPHFVVSSNSGTKMQQPQLFFSPAYMQTQPPQSTSTNPANATSRYHLQRPSGTSSPVTLASTAEAKAGAGAEISGKKGHMQPLGSISYAHSAQAGVQSKPASEQKQPASEQKQPAGNREPASRK